MSLKPGKHLFGPDNAELLVHTQRTGAAAKAGHDLTISVTSWSATVDVGENPEQTTVALSADGGSLRVREGRGGIQSLGDDDMASIRQSIDEEVLKRTPIEFRSTAVQTDGDRLQVRGELEMLGKTVPTEFDLTVGDDGELAGEATVKQTDVGLKPYSILFGTLKVADEVRVTIAAKL
jgi:polyisoprenoid-binding protein YceI